MKARLIIGLAATTMLLSACERPGYSYDFKPYIQNEQQALPEAYLEQSQAWVYPAGTPSSQITSSWRQGELIMKVYDTTWHKETRVEVGPQFYNLPASGQRGLAKSVARMYGTDNYLLIDYNRRQAVGVYTPSGLHMY